MEWQPEILQYNASFVETVTVLLEKGVTIVTSFSKFTIGIGEKKQQNFRPHFFPLTPLKQNLYLTHTTESNDQNVKKLIITNVIFYESILTINAGGAEERDLAQLIRSFWQLILHWRNSTNQSARF